MTHITDQEFEAVKQQMQKGVRFAEALPVLINPYLAATNQMIIPNQYELGEVFLLEGEPALVIQVKTGHSWDAVTIFSFDLIMQIQDLYKVI